MRWGNHILDTYLGDGSDVHDMTSKASRAIMDDNKRPVQGYQLVQEPVKTFLLQGNGLRYSGLPLAPKGECLKADT